MPSRPPTADLGRLRVLVVAEDHTSSVVLQSLLAWGASATRAEDAPCALELLREAARRGEPFDAVLVDLTMPEGAELVRVAAGDRALSTTRFVLLTSSAQRGDGGGAGLPGVAGHLATPVRSCELRDCLATAVGVAPERPGLSAPRAPAERASPPTRVLVADDNVINQMVAQRMLAKMGYDVDVAADGADAVHACTRVSYAAVLMDCQMPAVDGYEATARIRAAEGDGDRIPIIAMTASDVTSDRERCLRAGMDDSIAKPVTFGDLAEVLGRWVGDEGARGAQAEEEGAFDPEVVANLRDLSVRNGEDVVAELTGLFLQEAPTRLAALAEGVSRADARAVEEAAHALKGSSGTVGARRVERLCHSLQARAGAGEWGDATVLISKLETELQHVRDVVDAGSDDQSGSSRVPRSP